MALQAKFNLQAISLTPLLYIMDCGIVCVVGFKGSGN